MEEYYNGLLFKWPIYEKWWDIMRWKFGPNLHTTWMFKTVIPHVIQVMKANKVKFVLPWSNDSWSAFMSLYVNVTEFYITKNHELQCEIDFIFKKIRHSLFQSWLCCPLEALLCGTSVTLFFLLGALQLMYSQINDKWSVLNATIALEM